MSLRSNDPNSAYPIATVRISPLKDSSGNTDKLLVTIKKMNPQNHDESLTENPPLSKNIPEDQSCTKSTIIDKPKEVSRESQAKMNNSNPFPSVIDKTKNSVPCVRHAAENISRKAIDIPSEKIGLCSNCSKSMISYIFLVQDFLDSLVREISGVESTECLQCARQELRNSLSSREERVESAASTSTRSQHASDYRSRGDESRRDERQEAKSPRREDEGRSRSKRTSRAKAHRQVEKHESKSQFGPPATGPEHIRVQHQHIDFLYNVSSQTSSQKYSNEANSDQQSSHIREDNEHSVSSSSHYAAHQSKATDSSYLPAGDTKHDAAPQNEGPQWTHGPHQGNLQGQKHYAHAGGEESYSAAGENIVHDEVFGSPEKQIQLSIDGASAPSTEIGNGHLPENYSNPVPSPSLFNEEVDGIVSTLSNLEREVYDAARNRAGWESLTEPQERLGASPSGQIASEAFVTSCRNNAEALGCLALGTSLLLTRTSRTLCVLVSDGVSTSLRGPLASVFQVVQHVRSLDSLGSTKLALLEQPELGITFEKLNVWRLVQFNKCVFLNPDCLVIQNCDELFCHEELSAVPDIGWPDCFNSGMFVFSPSLNTFWQLMEFADKQGSYDGGDQGLLNSYYGSWSYDINKKLSFIYNLMANVSYTYTPAFNQFGRNVKIVQFHGSFKPWHVKFFTGTGQISPSSVVHPTYVQFVHIWLNIFRISVLQLMSKEIQSYAFSQKEMCAVEILRFFPLPSESEAEFFLSPPSVRLRLAEKKLQLSTRLPISDAQRRKSAEFPISTRPDVEEGVDSVQQKLEFADFANRDSAPKEQTSEAGVSQLAGDAPSILAASGNDDLSTKKEEVVDENKLPGSEIGDYQGMRAWEQGRMDYEGTDSSENVIKRLQFLMSRSK